MQRFIKFVTSLSFAVCTAVFAIITVLNNYVPDEIPVANFNSLAETSLYSFEENTDKSVTVKFLNIPVKTASIKSVNRKYVTVSGEIFGIRLYSDGIVIVGCTEVLTSGGQVSPAENASLRVGDVIKAINGRKVTRNSDLLEAVKSGESIELLTERNGERKVVLFTPVLSAEDNKYKAGLWVRDSTAGIGTITYFNSENLTFAGLGHGICDVDTGEIMPLLDGDAVYATVLNSYKGSDKGTGELCGVFEDNTIGSLLKNTPAGVFGTVTKNEISGTLMPVAMKYEVKTGEAEIISTIDNGKPHRYSIEITKLFMNDKGSKSMAITVTDKSLISKTGGIVQGMSGSPIIQNGMLVGAVTHVLVDDPTKGYGIFAQSMIEALNV